MDTQYNGKYEWQTLVIYFYSSGIWMLNNYSCIFRVFIYEYYTLYNNKIILLNKTGFDAKVLCFMDCKLNDYIRMLHDTTEWTQNRMYIMYTQNKIHVCKIERSCSCKSTIFLHVEFPRFFEIRYLYTWLPICILTAKNIIKKYEKK